LLGDAVARIVARTFEQGGATFDFATQSFAEPGDFWYFPKYPSLTAIVDRERLGEELLDFVRRHRERCREPGVWLGTWINPLTDKCYLDVTMRLADKDAAMSVARRVGGVGARRVVTMYNPALGQTAYVWEDVSR
jgi:hypothetical protein